MTNEKIVIIGAIATISAGFGGAFLGAIISYFYGIKLLQRQEFNKASNEFRALFIDEIFRIRRNAETLHERFGEDHREIAITNEKAKFAFETFLSDDQLIEFNIAWEQYKNPDEIEERPFNPINIEDRKELAEIRISHINTLLKFARQK